MCYVEMESSSSDNSSVQDKLPFQLAQIINRGTFGNVYVAKHYDPNIVICVIKTVSMERMPPESSPSATAAAAHEEVHISQQFNCDKLLKMISTHLSGSTIYTVMPLMVFESCTKIINRYFPYGIPEAAISMIMRDVLEGIHYLHNHHYIHRAVKGSSILINENGAAVISNFRFMEQLVPPATTSWTFKDMNLMKKNLNWLSPEMLKQDSRGYSYSSDIYSLGITALELANGIVPFADVLPGLMLVKKIRDERPKAWDMRYILTEGHASTSLLPRLPRRPVVGWTGRPDMPQSASSSSSSSPDSNKAGNRDVERMNQTYMAKMFSQEFQTFLDLTLIQNPVSRISSEFAQRLKFIRNSDDRPSTDLLQCLQLREPVHINESELGPELEIVKPNEPEEEEVIWDFGSD